MVCTLSYLAIYKQNIYNRQADNGCGRKEDAVDSSFPPQEAPGLFLFWLTDHQKRKAERTEYCGWEPHELTLEN